MECISSFSLSDQTWDELWEQEPEITCHDSCWDSWREPCVTSLELSCWFFFADFSYCLWQTSSGNQHLPAKTQSLSAHTAKVQISNLLVSPGASFSPSLSNTPVPCPLLADHSLLLLLPSCNQIVGLQPSTDGPWLMMILLHDNTKVRGSSSEPRSPVGHVIARVNNQYSTVECVASTFWILRLVFLNPIVSTKCPSVSPDSDEKRRAITLEMKLKIIAQV